MPLKDFVASKKRHDSHSIITTGYRISYSTTARLDAPVIRYHTSVIKSRIGEHEQHPAACAGMSVANRSGPHHDDARFVRKSGNMDQARTVAAFNPLSLSSSLHCHPCLIHVPAWCFFFRCIVCLSSCRPFAFCLAAFNVIFIYSPPVSRLPLRAGSMPTISSPLHSRQRHPYSPQQHGTHVYVYVSFLPLIFSV